MMAGHAKARIPFTRAMTFRFICLFCSLMLTSSVSAQYNFNKYLSDARVLLMHKEYAEAVGKLNICIQVRPADYQALYYRGLCKFFLNDNLGALADLEKATSNYSPWFYDACTYRALVKDRL